ncbi:MAG: histidinol dehydrogenase, partial [Synergistes sp.]|nr:histidinol dehydrogenase [Synergistes sp.]
MKIIKAAKNRSVSISKELSAAVAAIIDDVRTNGDEALMRLSRKFDGCGRSLFRVSRQEIDEAYGQLTQKETDDIKEAAENIRSFAYAQK